MELVNARNAMGETPLHKAVSAGAAFGSAPVWLDAIRLLLNYGADADIIDVAGETVLLRAFAVQGTHFDGRHMI